MSQFGSDDLASVIVRRDREFAGYAEGVIRAWNADTFEHTISVRGSDLHNLDVCAGVEALTYQPGDMVILTKWKPRSGKGSATYRIGSGGRIIRPGTGAAQKTIAFLRTSLGAAVALGVFGEAIHQDAVGDSHALSDTGGNWVDLPTSGPTVRDVTVGDTGRVFVMVGATVTCNANTDNAATAQGAISFEISGATSQAPDIFARSFRLSTQVFTAGPDQMAVNGGGAATTGVTVTGLNAGEHTFTAKYQAITFPASPPEDPVHFSNRTLMVIPF